MVTYNYKRERLQLARCLDCTNYSEERRFCLKFSMTVTAGMATDSYIRCQFHPINEHAEVET